MYSILFTAPFKPCTFDTHGLFFRCRSIGIPVTSKEQGFIMKRSVLVLFALVLSSPVHGTVYTWTDSKGVAHFTNRYYEIPARYRAKAKPLYPEQADTGAPQQNGQTPQAQPPAPAQAAKSDDAPKAAPPVVAPAPQQSPPEIPPRKSRRVRHDREE